MDASELHFRDPSDFGKYHPTTFSEAVMNLDMNADEPVFTKVKKLGKGQYGKVYLMTHEPSGTKCAVKFVLDDGIKDKEEWSLQSRRLFFREIETQLNLAKRIPGFSTFLGFSLPTSVFEESYPDEDKVALQHYPVLINEYMENGSLADHLETLTPTQRSKILFGVAVQVAYVHTIGVIHRDLKPANILLDANFEPHISDFGSAKLMSECSNQGMTTSVGTLTYCAPEVLKGDYDMKADVWSFGILVLELVTGRPPWGNLTDKKISVQLFAAQGPNFENEPFSDNLQGLLSACFESDPERRPTSKQVVEAMKTFDVVAEGTDMDEYNEFRQKMVDMYGPVLDEQQ